MCNTTILIFISLPAIAQAQSINLIEVLYSDSYDGRPSTEQSVLTFRHSNSWNRGDNFFFIDIARPDKLEDEGNIYVEWGPRLSLGRLFAGEAVGPDIIEDIYWVGELDYVHNRHVSKTTALTGISLDLDIPGLNFFKLHLQYRDDPTLRGNTQQLTVVWNYTFSLGDADLSFEGFLDYSGPEGRKYSNFHTQPQLIWKMNKNLGLGLEYQYWRNKNGIRGLTESVMQLMARWTF